MHVKVESTRKERKYGTGCEVDSNSLQHTRVVVAHTSDGVIYSAAVIGCGSEFKRPRYEGGRGCILTSSCP